MWGSKMQKYIEKAFLAVFIVVLGIVVGFCYHGKYYYISTSSYIIATIIILGLFIFYLFALDKLEKKLKFRGREYAKCILLVWGIALFWVGNYIKGEPTSDFWSIYESVAAFVEGEAIDWTVYARWENNLPLFCLLCIVSKVGAIWGVPDVIYSMAAFNIILTILSGYCIYWLIGKYTKESPVYMWFGLIVYMGFVPLWGSMYYVYTDGISMGFSVIGMTTCVYAMQRGRKYFFLAGLIWGIAFLIKPTAIFCALGFGITQLVFRNFKSFYKSMLIMLIGFILVNCGFSMVKEKLPIHEYSAEYKMPIQFWIALGMFGTGTYEENGWFIAQCMVDYDYEGRVEFCNQVIKDNINILFDAEHIRHKIKQNFADGHFGLREYTSNVTNDYFFVDGRYNKTVTVILSSYFYVTLLMMWLAGCKMIRRGSAEAELLLTIFIDLFGLILFLIVWEANNRQLYNHIPWFATGLALSMYYLLHKKEKQLK